MIAGYGMLAFRDPFGIRPLIIGRNEAMGGREYVVASKSVALEPLGFSVLRDVGPARRSTSTRPGSSTRGSAPRTRR
jgi:amidophosphoribosyltransferase